ncbi:hypothetical protein [Pseudoalteromonas sp. S16_S37]|uniref:hypothetical protein n=1 Tax=Pseudoalteromonas sp. S16_S37 TaxID=2720228 RepID=UPI001680149B|nr:hypothetical protein [Pseudoalteromonas sp. S16_S37]MBD1581273.1 hypothetical protein [Pseudoalteromonas sp. S16_S37]
MSIDLKLTEINAIVTEQTNEVSNLKTAIEDSWQEIDKVHQLAKQNHQAARDWQTKTGKVTFKDLNDTEYQVDTLATLINETQKINPHPEVMTKAQFDALRQMRKQQYAGSGFVEWGKCYTTEGNWSPQWINEGLFQPAKAPAYKNQLMTGSDGGGQQGKSSSNFPLCSVDGTQLRLSFVNSANPDILNQINFPDAPDGTKTYDSATGKVTQHASAEEAFGGLVTNGNFSTGDISGWSLNAANDEVSVTNGVATLTDIDGTYASLINQQVPTEAGKEYVLKVSIKVHENNHVFAAFGDTEFIERTPQVGKWYDVTVKHVATASSTRINVGTNSPTAVGESVSIRNVSVMPVTEQVITSRKDLVFLESWHEKIADKDVVYPLGNVQFGANTYEGIGLASNLVAQGYSAFGEWDTDTKGYGVKWSTLSAVNRVKFLKNPEHNIYYDPEAKAYIQVRYRVRVVEGYGDQWNELRPSVHEITTEWAIADRRRITFAQGSSQSVTSKVFVMKGHTHTIYTKQDNGVAEGEGTTIGSLSYGQTKPLTIPIAIVQRLNQGAYHPTYNPMGTAKVWHTGGFLKYWHDATGVEFLTSQAACFNYSANDTQWEHGKVAWGRWGSSIENHNDSVYGRLDQYTYYDAIYAGQVEDLRLNANKLDVNQLREDALNKAIAGTLRGKGKTIFTTVKAKKLAIASAYAGKYYINLFGTVDTQNGYEVEPQNRPFSYLYNSIRGNILYPIYVEPSGNIYTSDVPSALLENRFQNVGSSTLLDWQIGDDIYLVNGEQMTSEFDSLPWTDIVGHPERIAETFPNGVVGQWLPKLPDNSYGYPLNKKTTDSKLNATYTRDLGETWTNSDVGFDNIKNTSSGSWHPDIVVLLSYKTPAYFTQATSHQPVISTVGNVYATQANLTAYGNRLQPSLTGNVGTRANGAFIHEEVAVNKLSKYAPTGQLTWTQSLGDEPKHAPLNLDSQTEPSSAVKTLSTVVEKNGLLYLQFNGAELMYGTPEFTTISATNLGTNMVAGNLYYVHLDAGTTVMDGRYWYCKTSSSVNWNAPNWVTQTNGAVGVHHAPDRHEYLIPIDPASWGDDQIIPIINGENTKTDLNGNTVKVFCHHTQLPLGIASH